MELRLAGLIRRRTAVMEIGAQQLSNNFLEATQSLQTLGAFFGIDQPINLGATLPTHIIHGNLEHLNTAAPVARDFWRWLGFEYAAIDVDGSPGSIPLDLNFDSVPQEERGRYGLVTNCGTTEHVANQLNAFEVIHDLTAPNGLMMHQLPAQGYSNHGLVNYNLKFFWMLARSNFYRWIYADYSQSEPYPLPANIIDCIGEGKPASAARAADYKVTDAGLCVIVQKVFDIPFVPPLDVPTGSEVNNETLKRRYWTVFDRDAFARLQSSQSNGGSTGSADKGADTPPVNT
jgi:hypothetical protein